jgi:hypothetical protein
MIQRLAYTPANATAGNPRQEKPTAGVTFQGIPKVMADDIYFAKQQTADERQKATLFRQPKEPSMIINKRTGGLGLALNYLA